MQSRPSGLKISTAAVFVLTGLFLTVQAWAFPAVDSVENISGPFMESLNIRASVRNRGIVSVEETMVVVFGAEPLESDLTRGISGRYAERSREKYKTGFVLLDATLDGNPTKMSIRRSPESLRLTLAEKGSLFTPGPHIFHLKYELSNMVIFHTGEHQKPEYQVPDEDTPDRDSLVWRVVRDSSCPIQSVTIDISLPDGQAASGSSSPDRSLFSAFGGQVGDLPLGDGLEADDSGRLSTLSPLDTGKSLTLYMSWESGLVKENISSGSEWRLWDLVVFASLLCYYLFVWLRYGRLSRPDPANLSTTPPEGFSPGFLRTLRDLRPDSRALTAEILNLAVRGYIHLDDVVSEAEENPEEEISEEAQEKTPPEASARYSSLEQMMKRRYRLQRSSRFESPPTPTEQLLLHNLFAGEGENEIILDESAAERLQTTFRALARSFAVRGRLFLFQHTKFWTAGIFAFEAYTAFVMFFVLSQGVRGIEPDSTHALAFMAPLFLLAPFSSEENTGERNTVMFILRTCIPLFFCAVSLVLLKQQEESLGAIAALVGSIAVIGLFWKFMPVRSEKGLRILSQIEGFQLGLGSRSELKEEDTVEKFESLFPYACALDREQAMITRYGPLIARLRHRARWHTSGLRGPAIIREGAEYFTLIYELGEVIRSILSQKPNKKLKERYPK
ncbi:MAG: DUF2207 domain-containing protein [Synergistaceae bacterium]|jgi:hypothetical protein|nr:DUF2207 domain-containing protein [Synergistaceae bacterium]